MAGLEGTVKTPLGTVQKKTLLIGVGAVALFGGIVWYRQRNLGGSSDVVAEDAPINPATGYPYGSPEDAAALQSQAAYVSPAAGGGGGGSSNIPPSNVGFTSNGQWVQAVIEYMTSNSLVEDPAQLSSALGKYVTGAYVTDAEQSLIQQAIAVQGHAPVAGPNGYPPSINKTPNAPTTPTAPTAITNVSGLKLTGSTTTSLTFGWGWGAVKPDYILVYRDNTPVANVKGAATSYTLKGLKSKTAYIFQVRGVKGTTIGPTYTVTAKTR